MSKQYFLIEDKARDYEIDMDGATIYELIIPGYEEDRFLLIDCGFFTQIQDNQIEGEGQVYTVSTSNIHEAARNYIEAVLK